MPAGPGCSLWGLCHRERVQGEGAVVACGVWVCWWPARMFPSECQGLRRRGRSALSSISLDSVGAVGVSAWVQAETRVQEPCPGLRVAEKSWLLSLLGN